jgi:hypothetical protein
MSLEELKSRLWYMSKALVCHLEPKEAAEWLRCLEALELAKPEASR